MSSHGWSSEYNALKIRRRHRRRRNRAITRSPGNREHAISVASATAASVVNLPQWISAGTTPKACLVQIQGFELEDEFDQTRASDRSVTNYSSLAIGRAIRQNIVLYLSTLFQKTGCEKYLNLFSFTQ